MRDKVACERVVCDKVVCVKELCATTLCDVVCMTMLCVCERRTRSGRLTNSERDTEQKTRSQHKDMGNEEIPAFFILGVDGMGYS